MLPTLVNLLLLVGLSQSLLEPEQQFPLGWSTATASASAFDFSFRSEWHFMQKQFRKRFALKWRNNQRQNQNTKTENSPEPVIIRTDCHDSLHSLRSDTIPIPPPLSHSLSQFAFIPMQSSIPSPLCFSNSCFCLVWPGSQWGVI